jgi:hypothetical protein
MTTQNEIELSYMHFKDKVRKMMEAQAAYFRSNHDKQKLVIAKSLEKQVKDMLDPPEPKKQPQQDLFNDWLGQ